MVDPRDAEIAALQARLQDAERERDEARADVESTDFMRRYAIAERDAARDRLGKVEGALEAWMHAIPLSMMNGVFTFDEATMERLADQSRDALEPTP